LTERQTKDSSLSIVLPQRHIKYIMSELRPWKKPCMSSLINFQEREKKRKDEDDDMLDTQAISKKVVEDKHISTTTPYRNPL
jgi:hypothetical protein